MNPNETLRPHLVIVSENETDGRVYLGADFTWTRERRNAVRLNRPQASAIARRMRDDGPFGTPYAIREDAL